MIYLSCVLPLTCEQINSRSIDLSDRVLDQPPPLIGCNLIQVEVFGSCTNIVAWMSRDSPLVYIQINGTEEKWSEFVYNHDRTSVLICVIIFEKKHEDSVLGYTMILIFNNHALIMRHQHGKIERCEMYYDPSVSGETPHERLITDCFDDKGNLITNCFNYWRVFPKMTFFDFCRLDLSKIETFESTEKFFQIKTILSIKFPTISNVQIVKHGDSSIIIYFIIDGDESKSARIEIYLDLDTSSIEIDEDEKCLVVLNRIDTTVLKKHDEHNEQTAGGFEVVAMMFIYPEMELAQQFLPEFVDNLLGLNSLRFDYDGTFSDSD